MSNEKINKETLVNGLTSNDWKEITVAPRGQMIVALERPSDVSENAVYYEKLADKISRITSLNFRKERNLV